jgi:hypothetical protein
MPDDVAQNGQTEGAVAAPEAPKEAAPKEGGAPEAQTPTTYSEDQVLGMLSKANEVFEKKLAQVNGKHGSKIQTLEKTLNQIEEWNSLDADQKQVLSDRALLAQEHTEVLAQKFNLTERQKNIVARGQTAQDRAEAAEAMVEGRGEGSTTQPSNTTALDELAAAVGVRRGNVATETFVSTTGNGAQQGALTLEQLAAADLRGKTPQQIQEHKGAYLAAMRARGFI